MGDAVGLQGLEALEEQEGLDVALAGRIAFEHGLQVRLGGVHQAGLGRIGLLAQLAHAHGFQLVIGQLTRQLIGQGLGQPVMLQDHRVQQAVQRRFGLGRGLGLIAQGRPHRRRGMVFDQFQTCAHSNGSRRSRP